MLGTAVFLGWCLGLGTWAWFVDLQNKKRIEKLHKDLEKETDRINKVFEKDAEMIRNFDFWGY